MAITAKKLFLTAILMGGLGVKDLYTANVANDGSHALSATKDSQPQTLRAQKSLRTLSEYSAKAGFCETELTVALATIGFVMATKERGHKRGR